MLSLKKKLEVNKKGEIGLERYKEVTEKVSRVWKEILMGSTIALLASCMTLSKKNQEGLIMNNFETIYVETKDPVSGAGPLNEKVYARVERYLGYNRYIFNYGGNALVVSACALPFLKGFVFRVEAFEEMDMGLTPKGNRVYTRVKVTRVHEEEEMQKKVKEALNSKPKW